MKVSAVIKTGVFVLTVGSTSAAGAYTFTNCGQMGDTGPTQAQCDTAYSGTDLDGNVTINTQGIQEWVVPTSGLYAIEAFGASGGDKPDTYNAVGGLGARMKGDFVLSAGQVLKVIVGQRGGNPDPAANNSSGGSGGGGGSYVFHNVTDPFPLIAAGGGGGLGAGNTFRENGLPGLTTISGGSNATGNGGIDGQGGETSDPSNPYYNSGGGGGWLSDGQDGTNPGVAGGGKAPRNGAIGGHAGRPTYSAIGGFGGGGGTNDGGGGGGGFSGGAGGKWSPLTPGGGGGSYNAGTNQSNSAGVTSGHGSVSIVFLSGLPAVSLSPVPLSFGDVLVGTNSGSQSVTLENTGFATLNVSNVAVTGGFTHEGTSTCSATPFTLAPAASCTLEVSLTPADTIAYSGEIQVTSDAATSVDTSSLTGTGVVPEISLSVSSVYFGDLVVDQATGPVSITITNVGTGPLDISDVSLPPDSPFSITHDCGIGIAVSDSCTIDVTFRPTSNGYYSQDIAITSNVGNSIVTLIASAGYPASRSVPTLSVWGLGILAGLLGIVGMRRRMK